MGSSSVSSVVEGLDTALKYHAVFFGYRINKDNEMLCHVQWLVFMQSLSVSWRPCDIGVKGANVWGQRLFLPPSLSPFYYLFVPENTQVIDICTVCCSPWKSTRNGIVAAFWSRQPLAVEATWSAVMQQARFATINNKRMAKKRKRVLFWGLCTIVCLKWLLYL